MIIILTLFLNIAAADDSANIRKRHALADELGSRMGILDSPLLNTFRHSCYDLAGTLPAAGNELRHICEVAINSGVCKKVADKTELLDCDGFGHRGNFDALDGLANCAEGLWDSVWDILEFLWTVMVNIHKIPGKFLEYAESLQLYMVNEYDLAYDKADPPKRINALKAMGANTASVLWNGLARLAAGQYREFGCLRREAQIKRICWVMGTFATPWAMLKGLNMMRAAYRNVFTIEKASNRVLRKARKSLGIKRAQVRSSLKTLKELEAQGEVAKGVVQVDYINARGVKVSAFIHWADNKSVYAYTTRNLKSNNMSYSTKIPKKQIVAVSHHPEVAKGWKIYYKIRNSDSVISDTSYTLQIHLADGTLGTGRIWSFNSWKGQPGFLKVDIEGVGYHYVHPTRLKKIISKRTYRNKPTKPEVPFEDMGHTIFGE